VWDLRTTASDLYTPVEPSIASFTAAPEAIIAGETVTLEWKTEDAVQVEIDNELGVQDPSGSASVDPRETTTYTLTATGPLGATLTQEVIVTVEGLTLTAPTGGEVLAGGGELAITWTSSEFTSQVKIEFFDGTDWTELAAGVDDTWSWDWTVPNQDLPAVVTDDPVCKVRISDATDGAPSHESAEFAVQADTDIDEMPDWWELLYWSEASGAASGAPAEDDDSDELTNLEEYQAGTDPTKADTDGDQLPDGWETLYEEFDPTNPDSDGDETDDGADDLDDGALPNPNYALTNLQEYQAGTDPTKSDTDGDQLPDGWEILYGNGDLDPNKADSDEDDTRDDLEDTDADGRDNLWEYQHDTDPTDDQDPPAKASTKSTGECAALPGDRRSRDTAGIVGFGCWILALAAGILVLRRRSVAR
jgi:hypothetical protein